MSEPFFPPPPGKKPYREPERAPDAPAPPKTVVHRAEPPKEEEAPIEKGKAPPKLSREEVSALLATSGTNSSVAAQCGKRAAIVVIPIGLIRWGLVLLFGESAPVAAAILSGLCALGAIAWTAAPLWKQKRDGWS